MQDNKHYIINPVLDNGDNVTCISYDITVTIFFLTILAAMREQQQWWQKQGRKSKPGVYHGMDNYYSASSAVRYTWCFGTHVPCNTCEHEYRC